MKEKHDQLIAYTNNVVSTINNEKIEDIKKLREQLKNIASTKIELPAMLEIPKVDETLSLDNVKKMMTETFGAINPATTA